MKTKPYRTINGLMAVWTYETGEHQACCRCSNRATVQIDNEPLCDRHRAEQRCIEYGRRIGMTREAARQEMASWKMCRGAETTWETVIKVLAALPAEE